MANKFETMKTADFHQDRLNPWLNEILQNPEFDYTAERKKQLPKEGLRKLDLHFATIYRRANDEIKAAAQSVNEEVLGNVRVEYDSLIDYYNTTEAFKVITKPEDLELRPDKDYDAENVVLHLEGGDILTNPDLVNGLYDRGVRSIGLMYSHDNLLGGGASGDKKRGLTSLGKKVVERMMELGMIIDTAHANRKTSHDILDEVEQYDKAVTTHTALGGTNPTSDRTITPALLRKVANKGGVVGFTPATPFFPTFEQYIDTYKKASDITGSVKNLAVGSDFGGLDAKHLFQEFDEIGKFAVIAEKLSEQGRFTDEEIADIMYGNIARIVERLKK